MLGSFSLAFPPLNEQAKIIQAVDLSTADISAAAANANREIALLQEFGTRLIADVVTGKLDIREVAASLPERADGPEPLGEADGADEFQDTEGEDSDREEAAA